jgi:hypothetical protein
MNIPREEIQKMNEYIEKINNGKFIHYRDLNKIIDTTNFQISTKTDFKKVKIDADKNAHWQFNLIEKQPNITYRFISKTGSKYLIDANNNFYRLSDHWGAVRSCLWTLEGEGELRMSVFINGEWELGVANLKDFQIFRRKQEKRADFVQNPNWINQVMVLSPLKEKLHKLRVSRTFNKRSAEEKELIGKNYGKLQYLFNEINT